MKLEKKTLASNGAPGSKSVTLLSQFAMWLGTLMREGLVLNSRMEIPVPKRQFFLNGIVSSGDGECTMLMSHSVSLPLYPTYIVGPAFKFYTGTKNWNLRMYEDDDFQTIATFADTRLETTENQVPQPTVLYLGDHTDLEIIDDDVLQVDKTFTLSGTDKNLADAAGPEVPLLDDPVCTVVCAKKIRFDHSSIADHPVYTVSESPVKKEEDNKVSAKVPVGIKSEHLVADDITNYPIRIATTSDMILNDDSLNNMSILNKGDMALRKRRSASQFAVANSARNADHRISTILQNQIGGTMVPKNESQFDTRNVISTTRNAENPISMMVQNSGEGAVAPKDEFIKNRGYQYVYENLIPAIRSRALLDQLSAIPNAKYFAKNDTYEPIVLPDVTHLRFESVLQELDKPLLNYKIH